MNASWPLNKWENLIPKEKTTNQSLTKLINKNSLLDLNCQRKLK